MKKLRRALGSLTSGGRDQDESENGTNRRRFSVVSSLSGRGRSESFSSNKTHEGTYVRYETQSVVSNEPCCSYGDPTLTPDDPLFTKLHKWAYLGELTKIKKFLTKSNVNVEDGMGRTPLHLCAFSGSPEAVSFLLNSGANPEAEDKDGRTPFLRAVEKANIRNVQVLLQYKVRTRAKDHYENTALHLATNSRSKDLLELLLDIGLDHDVSNLKGETPLHIAAGNLDNDMVSCLLAHGADPNSRDKECVTPLMLAAKQGCKPLIETLIRAGSDVSNVDRSSWSASSYAKYCGYLELHDWIESQQKKEGAIPSTSVSMLGLGATVRSEQDEDKVADKASIGDDYSLKSWSEGSFDESSRTNKAKIKIPQFISSSKDIADSDSISSTSLSGPPKPPRLHDSSPNLSIRSQNDKQNSSEDDSGKTKGNEAKDSWGNEEENEITNTSKDGAAKPDLKLDEGKDTTGTYSEVSFGDDDSSILPLNCDISNSPRKPPRINNSKQNEKKLNKRKYSVTESVSLLFMDPVQGPSSKISEQKNVENVSEDLATALIKNTIESLDRENTMKDAHDSVALRLSGDKSESKDDSTQSQDAYSNPSGKSEISENSVVDKSQSFGRHSQVLESGKNNEEESDSSTHIDVIPQNDGTLGRIGTLQQVDEIWEANASLSLRDNLSENSGGSLKGCSLDKRDAGMAGIRDLFSAETSNIVDDKLDSVSKKTSDSIANDVTKSGSNFSLAQSAENSFPNSLNLSEKDNEVPPKSSDSLNNFRRVSSEPSSLNTSLNTSTPNHYSDLTLSLDKTSLPNLKYPDNPEEVQNMISSLKIRLKKEFTKKKLYKSKVKELKSIEKTLRQQLRIEESLVLDKETEFSKLLLENRELEATLLKLKDDLNFTSASLQKNELFLEEKRRENEELKSSLKEMESAAKLLKNELIQMEENNKPLESQDNTDKTSEIKNHGNIVETMDVATGTVEVKIAENATQTHNVVTSSKETQISNQIIDAKTSEASTATQEIQFTETVSQTDTPKKASVEIQVSTGFSMETPGEPTRTAKKETENNSIGIQVSPHTDDTPTADASTATMEKDFANNITQTEEIEKTTVETQASTQISKVITAEASTSTEQIKSTEQESQTKGIDKSSVEIQVSSQMNSVETLDTSTSTLEVKFSENDTQTELVEKFSVEIQVSNEVSNVKTTEASTGTPELKSTEHTTQTEGTETFSVETQVLSPIAETQTTEASTSTLELESNENFTQTDKPETSSIETQVSIQTTSPKTVDAFTDTEKVKSSENFAQTEETNLKGVSDANLRAEESTSTLKLKAVDNFSQTETVGSCSIETQVSIHCNNIQTSEACIGTLQVISSENVTQTEIIEVTSVDTQVLNEIKTKDASTSTYEVKSNEHFAQTEDIDKSSVQTQVSPQTTEASTGTIKIDSIENVVQTEKIPNSCVGTQASIQIKIQTSEVSTNTKEIKSDKKIDHPKETEKTLVKSPEKDLTDPKSFNDPIESKAFDVDKSSHPTDKKSTQTLSSFFGRSDIESQTSFENYLPANESQANLSGQTANSLNSSLNKDKIIEQGTQTHEQIKNNADLRDDYAQTIGMNNIGIEDSKKFYDDLTCKIQDLNDDLNDTISKTVSITDEAEKRLFNNITTANENSLKINGESIQKGMLSVQEIVLQRLNELNENILSNQEMQKLCEDIQNIRIKLNTISEITRQLNILMNSSEEASQGIKAANSMIKDKSEVVDRIMEILKHVSPRILDSISDDLKSLKNDSSKYCTKTDLEVLKLDLNLEPLNDSLKRVIKNAQDNNEFNKNHLESSVATILNNLKGRENEFMQLILSNKEFSKECVNDITSFIEQVTSTNDELLHQNLKRSLCNLDVTVGENFEILQNLLTDLKDEMNSRVKEVAIKTGSANKMYETEFENLFSKLEQINDSLTKLSSYIEATSTEATRSPIHSPTREQSRGDEETLTALCSQSKMILSSLEKCQDNLAFIKDNEKTLEEEIKKNNLVSGKQFLNQQDEFEALRKEIDKQNSLMNHELVEQKKHLSQERVKRDEVEKEFQSLMKNNHTLKEENISLKFANENLKKRCDDLDNKLFEEQKLRETDAIKASYRSVSRVGNELSEDVSKRYGQEELINTLNRELELEKRKNRLHETEKSKLQESVERDKDGFINQIQQLKSVVSAKDGRIRTLERQILQNELVRDNEQPSDFQNEFLIEIKMLKDKKKSLENDLKSKIKLIQELKEKNSEKENELKDVETDLNLKLEVIGEYKNEIIAMKTKIKSLMQKLEDKGEHEDDSYKLKHKIQEMESESSYKQTLILNLKERLSTLSQEKSHLLKEISIQKENELSVDALKKQKEEMEETLKVLRADYERVTRNLEENFIPKSKLSSFYQEVESYLHDTYMKKLGSQDGVTIERINSLERVNSLLREREQSLKLEIRDLEDQLKILNAKVSVLGYNAHLWKSKYQTLFENHYKVPRSATSPNLKKRVLEEQHEIPPREQQHFQENVLREINELLDKPYEESQVVRTAIDPPQSTNVHNDNDISQSSHFSLTLPSSSKTVAETDKYAAIELIEANVKRHLQREKDAEFSRPIPRKTKAERDIPGTRKSSSSQLFPDAFDEYSQFLKRC